MLEYRPVAAEYSTVLDRIIMISGNPNRLRIVNPTTSDETSVVLQQPPLSLSISPDGRFAAVGHDASIVYVNLTTSTVEKTYPVPVVARNVVLDSAWVYNLPAYQGDAVSVHLPTGTTTPNTDIIYGSGGRLNKARPAIYGTRDGLSPNDVQRYEMTNGVLKGQTDSPYHGDYCIYGPVWFSHDGSRIYTGCGTVFRSSNDPKEDMYYLSALPEVSEGISALTESAGASFVAVVPRVNSFPSPGSNQTTDSTVLLFETSFLRSAGQIALRPLTAGGRTVRARGRWVFFNAAGSALYAVVQAEEGSGLLNDFAIQRLSLADPEPCGAAFETNALAVSGLGSSAKVKITARADCAYKVASDSFWIQFMGGANGLGDGTLNLSVLANPGPAARSGRLTMAGQTLTISQAPPNLSAGMSLLGYSVVEAAYSLPIDKLILVSANPNALHLYDPVTRVGRSVTLPAAPLSLSVRPDGKAAAVGHNGWLSYVNLETVTLEKTLQVVTDVWRVVLAPNGYAYLFPSRDWSDIYSLHIATGTVTATRAIYNGRVPRLDVSGKSMYVGGNWFSKWDISQGTAKLANSGSTNTCGNLWLTRDGRRMFTACGQAWTTSEIASEDVKYNGTLSEAPGVSWADHSAERRLTAVIPSSRTGYFDGLAGRVDDSIVQFYDDAFLGYEGAVALPSFDVGGARFAGLGRYVFWNRGGTALYAVVQADNRSGLMNTFAVVEILPNAARKTSVSTLVNAASQQATRLSPGQIVTLGGENLGPIEGVSFTVDPATNSVPTVLGGTRVLFNGTAAPILYASQRQINAVVPFEVGFSNEINVQVNAGGLLSNTLKMPLAESSPAIFTIDSSGRGQAVAVNQDGTLCDGQNPAPRGSVVTLYFTGGGSYNFGAVTGGVAPTTARPLRLTTLATVGDQPAQVLYSGAAPGFVEGLHQLNLRIPDNAPLGNTQSVILTVGTASSPNGVTIAVR